jgi:hypothetical protein
LIKRKINLEITFMIIIMRKQKMMTNKLRMTLSLL